MRALVVAVLLVGAAACSGTTTTTTKTGDGGSIASTPSCDSLVGKAVVDAEWKDGCLAEKDGKSTLEIGISYDCTDGTKLHNLGGYFWGRTGQLGQAGALPDDAQQDCSAQGGVHFTPN
ncbi:MAG: hypothetical protein QOE63_1511 [Acidimicrobiaceae bacterium]|jgi:hypothetical protein